MWTAIPRIPMFSCCLRRTQSASLEHGKTTANAPNHVPINNPPFHTKWYRAEPQLYNGFVRRSVTEYLPGSGYVLGACWYSMAAVMVCGRSDAGPLFYLRLWYLPFERRTNSTGSGFLLAALAFADMCRWRTPAKVRFRSNAQQSLRPVVNCGGRTRLINPSHKAEGNKNTSAAVRRNLVLTKQPEE